MLPRVAEGKSLHKEEKLASHLTIVYQRAQSRHVLHEKVPVVDDDDHDDANAF